MACGLTPIFYVILRPQGESFYPEFIEGLMDRFFVAVHFLFRHPTSGVQYQ